MDSRKVPFFQRVRVLICTLFALLCVNVAAEPCDVSEYYQNFNAGTDSGTVLKKKLYDLIKGHAVIPYTSTDEAMKIIDQNPSNPAQIIGIYSQVGITVFPDEWNREHGFPRSRGVGDSGPDYSDLHALFPCDATLNSLRSNKYFDECSPSDGCTSPAATSTRVAASGSGVSSDFWQPPTAVRGDLARAIFYMATRYSDASEPNTEKLQIKECSSFSTCGANTMGRLSTLLKWNEEDPPDATEIARNNRICSDYQGNRNPFVDSPELVNLVFSPDNMGSTPESSNSIDDQTIYVIIGTVTGIVVISAVIVLFIARGTRLRNYLMRNPSANKNLLKPNHYI